MTTINTPHYPVYFNDKVYAELSALVQPAKYSMAILIADSNTSQHCLPTLLGAFATEVPIEIIEIEAGEQNKTIETCTQVWEALAEIGADRKSIIINVGGGMVTDLGGFIAATFKRGIDFVNVPTSLLGMVDASIGGKTGVDLGSLKNQVGVITNPKAVFIDTKYLQTLPQQEMLSGLAEMLKHGLIADRGYWNNFTDLESLTSDDLDVLIHRSVDIKNEIVSQDPLEKGLRKVLNFGHTLGHAIESYCLENEEMPFLLHGEAIAIGMILEAFISTEQGLLQPEEYREIKTVISSLFPAVSFSANEIGAITKLLTHDKKNEYGEVHFVLLEAIGRPVYGKKVDKNLIYKAFEDYSKQY